MGFKAIKHLKEYIDRARVEDPEKVLKTTNYKLYLVFKAKYLISYCIGNEKPAIKLFKQIIFDLILMEKVYNNNK